MFSAKTWIWPKSRSWPNNGGDVVIYNCREVCTYRWSTILDPKTLSWSIRAGMACSGVRINRSARCNALSLWNPKFSDAEWPSVATTWVCINHTLFSSWWVFEVCAKKAWRWVIHWCQEVWSRAHRPHILKQVTIPGNLNPVECCSSLAGPLLLWSFGGSLLLGNQNRHDEF